MQAGKTQGSSLCAAKAPCASRAQARTQTHCVTGQTGTPVQTTNHSGRRRGHLHAGSNCAHNCNGFRDHHSGRARHPEHIVFGRVQQRGAACGLRRCELQGHGRRWTHVCIQVHPAPGRWHAGRCDATVRSVGALGAGARRGSRLRPRPATPRALQVRQSMLHGCAWCTAHARLAACFVCRVPPLHSNFRCCHVLPAQCATTLRDCTPSCQAPRTWQTCPRHAQRWLRLVARWPRSIVAYCRSTTHERNGA